MRAGQGCGTAAWQAAFLPRFSSLRRRSKKHILLSCLLLLALCATALAAPVEKQTFRVVAPEGWTVTAVPDVSEGVVLVAPDKSVSVTIVTAASGTMTPEQLAADYEQKLHAARVAQNGNYYGLKGMAGDLPLEVCLWTFDGMHGVASIVGRTGHPALQGIVDSLEFYK